MADEKNESTSKVNQGEIYFAADDAKKLAASALGKADTFFNNLRANAMIDKWYKMWQFYHGAFNSSVGTGHQIDFSGEQGELTLLPVNHFRNIARHMLTMITSNRPVMESRAINTDYKSLAQTYLANGILDYYMRERGLEDKLVKAVEYAIVMGSGFIKMEWNATTGEAFDVDPETGEFAYQGDLEFSNLDCLNVIVDGTRESWDNDWVMVRTWKNRFDLAAKYPEMAEKIKSLPTKDEASLYRLAIWSNDSTDDIAVYEFYHKRTEALPEGRYCLFLDSDVILLDTKLPYREIPIYRITAGDILGTPYGYSPMFDIFPIQEGINSLMSTIMTNQNAFGVQNIYVPRGADVNFNALSGGLNIIEANAEPKPLNLTQTPKEIFDFVNMLVQSAETISGINSVARGNPEASLRSGNALALVQSMALQFMSGLQQSYVKLIEDSGTGLITMFKDFAAAPRVVAIVGKNNRGYMKEFIGEDISAINRVVVDMGNPLSRSVAGRVQMAEQMMQMGIIKNPQQYFQVMNTGRLDSMFEGEMSELLLVKSENERLMEGQEVRSTILDDHKLHISEHKSVLADPDLRQNPDLVKLVLDHIQEHIDALRNTDPQLLQLIGQQPLQPVQGGAGMPAPGGGGAAPQQQLPGQGAQQDPNQMQQNPNQQQPGVVSGPGINPNTSLPTMPQVPQEALANPEMQMQAMNNVKQ